jgi:hypothetical protein
MGRIRIENFFDPPSDCWQTFWAPPLIKKEPFLTPPPPVWIEKLTAMKQVCVAGKVRY